MNELDLARWLNGSENKSSQLSGRTRTYSGTALSDSANGRVEVDLGGDIITESGSQGIEIPCGPQVKQGDKVLITTVNGSPYVSSVDGWGDYVGAQASFASAYVGSLTARDITADRINATVGYFGTLEAGNITADQIVANQATIDNLDATYAKISDLEADYITADQIEATYATINNLESDYITADNIAATYATISNLTSNYITADNIAATYATIDTLESDYATIDTLESDYATIDELHSDYANIRQLDAGYAKIVEGRITNAVIDQSHVENLSNHYAHIVNGVIDNAKIDKADVNGLAATYATINELHSNYVTATNLASTYATINELHSDYITANNIASTYATINTLQSNYITANAIASTYATINELQSNYATIDTLESDYITADNIASTYATVNELQSNYATINELQSNYATIDTLESDYITADNIASTYATINTLQSNYITANAIASNYAQANFANVNNAWVENGVIRDGAITSAMILSLSADKLTAGTIDASDITVTNLNADNITTGTINGQRIGQGSLSLDKLEEDVYTEDEVNTIVAGLNDRIDGAIETFTGTVVPTLNNAPANAWTTTKLRDQHVGDVYYVVNSESQQSGYCYRFTKSGNSYSWQLIKDSDVTAALSRLQTAEGKIGDIETFDTNISKWKVDTDESLTEMQRAHTDLVTRVETAEGTLTTKVDQTTYNNLESTVNGHTTTIGSLTTTTQTLRTDVNSAQSAANAAQTTANSAIKSSVQLWYSKANTTAPDKPSAHVTSASTAGGDWRTVVPTYNASYPYYYYCYEYLYADGTYGWSAVIYDRATTESQQQGRKGVADAAAAQSTANGAVTTANSAKSTAEGASADAATAVETANTANSNASSAVTTANTANTNASNAVTTANTANTNASNAVTTANTANTNASNAVTTANTANTNASNALNAAKSKYATSSTVASQAAKEASCSNFSLFSGADIYVKFTNANTAANPTLNVNNTGAKTILAADGTALDQASYWKAGETVHFAYNGSAWLAIESSAQEAASAVAAEVVTVKNSLNSVTDTVTEHTRKIGSLESTVATKADGSTVETIQNNLTTVSTNLEGFQTYVGSTYSTKAQLSDAINSIEVGGRNLLRWSSLDYDPEQSYSMHTSSYVQPYSGGAPITFATEDGFKCWRIDGELNKTKWIRFHQNRIYPKYGDVYTMSADVKLVNFESGTTNRFLALYFGGETIDGVWRGPEYNKDLDANIPNHNNEGWVRVNITATYGDYNWSGMASIYIYARDWNGTIFVKNVKLEKGNKATDWTPAPEDLATTDDVEEVQSTADAALARAGMFKINMAERSFTTAQWKTYGVRGTATTWSTGSGYDNSKLRVGDTAYMTGTVTDGAGGTATIIGNVTAINGTTSVILVSQQLIFGGDALDTTFSRVVQAETKIDQNDEAITLTAQKIDSLQIGGRNLLLDSSQSISGTNSQFNAGKVGSDIPAGTKLVASVHVKATNLVWATGSGSHRLGFELSGNSGQYIGVWTQETGTYDKRISQEWTLNSDLAKGHWWGIYIQNAASGTIEVSNPKLEVGTLATDWTPAPEDMATAAELKVANDNISSKVSSTDYNGAKIASLINQSASTVKIQAAHVEINGTTTFTNTGGTTTTVQDYLNGNYDTKGAANTAVSNALRIPDTRSDNQPPSWYFTNYPKRTITEFKSTSAIGLSGEVYCYLTTVTPWGDASGGYPKQTAQVANKSYWRVGVSASSWSEWQESETVSGTYDKINAITIGGTNLLPSRVFTENSINGSTREIPSVHLYQLHDAFRRDDKYLWNQFEENTRYVFSFAAYPIDPDAYASNRSGLFVLWRYTDGTSDQLTLFYGEENYSEEIRYFYSNPSKSISQLCFSYGNSSIWTLKYLKLEKGDKATDWSPSPEDMATAEDLANTASELSTDIGNANGREQIIYYTGTLPTESVSANNTWVINSSEVQNVWTTTRPRLSEDYPVLWVATQRQTVAQMSGTTCSCTTPVIDQTLTVIDGGHITTGTIDAAVVDVVNLDADNITAGTLSADRIATGSLSISKFYDLSIGGRNLLQGTNQGKNNWTIAAGSGSYGPIETIDEIGVRYTVNTPSTNWCVISFLGSDNCENACNLLSSENESFTLSFDFRSSIILPSAAVFKFAQSNELNNQIYFGSFINTKTNTWEHFELTGTTLGVEATTQRVYVNYKFPAGTYDFKNIKLEKGAIATDWTPAPEDMATSAELEAANNQIELRVKSSDYNGAEMVSRINASASTVKIQAAHVEIDGTTVFKNTGGTATTVQDYLNGNYDAKGAAIAAVTYLDTRNDNQPPSWYMANYPKRSITEFKLQSVIGLSDSMYCYMTTDTPWSDSSGGYPVQKVQTTKKTYYRIGISNSQWGSWQEDAAGGRNLLLANGFIHTPTAYRAYKIPTSIALNELEVGDYLSIQFWGVSLDSDSVAIVPHWGGGSIAITDRYVLPDSNGYWSYIYKVTEANKTHADAANKYIHIYNFAYNHTGSNLSISKWKIERGNKFTDWTPAPEDVDADISAVSDVANAAAPKANAVARTQRIYYRKTSVGSPGQNNTWLTSSGNGYGNWSLSVPQLTYNNVKYPYLYTAVQTQTVAQQASSATTNNCSCSNPLLDDSTTIIDGGNIITGSIAANKLDATTVKATFIDTAELNASQITAGTLSADRIAGGSLSISKLSDLSIGGRNLLLDSSQSISGTNAAKYGTVGSDIPAGTKLIASVHVKAINLTWGTGSGARRMGFELAGNSNQWIGVWTFDDGTYDKRISQEWTLASDLSTGHRWGIYIQNAASGTIEVSNPKLEIGTIPTDWTPAPEDMVTNASFDVQNGKIVASVQSLAAGNNTYTDPSGNSATSGIGTKIEQTANNITFRINSGMSYYATSTTEANVAAKTATTMRNTTRESELGVTFFQLVEGATVDVKFTKANTVANPTLSVDNTAAKPIRANGAALTANSIYNWSAETVVTFTYDGTYWNISNSPESAFIRMASNGVLVAKPANTVGALVNSSGSFDIVPLSWSGNTPTVNPNNSSPLASFGSSTIKLGSSGYNMELTSSSLTFKNGSTTLQQLTGTANTMYVSGKKRMVLNSSGLTLYDSDGSNVMTAITNSSFRRGLNSNYHVIETLNNSVFLRTFYSPGETSAIGAVESWGRYGSGTYANLYRYTRCLGDPSDLPAQIIHTINSDGGNDITLYGPNSTSIEIKNKYNGQDDYVQTSYIDIYPQPHTNGDYGNDMYVASRGNMVISSGEFARSIQGRADSLLDGWSSTGETLYLASDGPLNILTNTNNFLNNTIPNMWSFRSDGQVVSRNSNFDRSSTSAPSTTTNYSDFYTWRDINDETIGYVGPWWPKAESGRGARWVQLACRTVGDTNNGISIGFDENENRSVTVSSKPPWHYGLGLYSTKSLSGTSAFTINSACTLTSAYMRISYASVVTITITFKVKNQQNNNATVTVGTIPVSTTDDNIYYVGLRPMFTIRAESNRTNCLAAINSSGTVTFWNGAGSEFAANTEHVITATYVTGV